MDWYPWGDEAFAVAAGRDVPVLLSVGYSSCHWCHVMAHESFEDEQTASQMNESFVAVKVDREERPDVDAVYMEAVQAMTGRGGWPMTVFLTPDGRPFYAGTYFPNRDAHGMPSFRTVLDAVADAWASRRADVEKQADQLSDSVRRSAGLADQLFGAAQQMGGGAEGGASQGAVRVVAGGYDWPSLAKTLTRKAVSDIASRFDSRYGGIGPAPKFPQTSLIDLCLREHRYANDASALGMATSTLDAMAAGGIYDHLGGGFARYSTDATWTVPHFEKMLYDQACLVSTYVSAWQVTGRDDYLQVVEETIGYVVRDLAYPGADGLCAAEDADSEGVEGLFYTWTPAELRDVLGDDAPSAAEWYGVTPEGNFEGRSILRRPAGGELIRPAEIEQARARLFGARSDRVRPGRDDKVLTEWNAMFVSALARAAAATGRRDWSERAVAIGRFLLEEMRNVDGRFMRSWQDGRARFKGYATDYAWVVDCFTRLAELTGAAEWLVDARSVAREMLRLFSDERTGAVWTTGSDADPILVRPLDLTDDATPSGASVAATALLRLGALTGDEDLTRSGERILELVLPLASEHPLALANAIGAMGLAGGAVEVVIAGDRPDLLAAVRSRYEPDAVVAWGDRTASPLWEGRSDGFGYVCRGGVCRLPVDSVEALVGQLEDGSTVTS